MTIPYRFTPWSRRGLSRAHANVDTAGGALATRPRITVGLTLQAKQDGNAATAVSGNIDLTLYGPGDVIGIHNHGTISIGDTFTEGEQLAFTGIPNFAPELFRRARLRDPLKLKQLQKGLAQLSEEGATQFFRPLMSNDLILGAVGTLQFDVVAYRLKDEYGVDATFEQVQVATARWIRSITDGRFDLHADGTLTIQA